MIEQMNIILWIIFIVVSIICFAAGRYTVVHPQKLDNLAVLQEREEIQAELSNYKNKIEQATIEYNAKVQRVKDEEKHAEKIRQVLLQKFEEEQRALEIEYQKLREEKERESSEKQQKLEEEYLQLVQEKQESINEVNKKLAALKATRDAVVAANRREREVSDSPRVYNIQMDEDDNSDIRYIFSIMGKLHNPTVLGKYIWSTYYQKKYKALATNVLGDDAVCGIYKITNQLTKECYVGQSKNIAKRWSEHLRSACGASAASKSNVLYDAMKRDGISNFSFELLERCDPEDLDEKEAYFISLYSADTIGYNCTRGNKQ